MNTIILRNIDKYFFWFLIFLFFWLKYLPFRKNKYLKNPKKILVIRLWALWSSLLIFPMIKQLKNYYWENIKIDLLASSRNKIVFKNQSYFNEIYNFFSFKDFLKILLKFKNYDIVIDTEEYFRITALLSCYLWKLSIWFWEILFRKFCYNYFINYEWKHQVLEYLKLLEPLNIKYETPEKLEELLVLDKDKIKVDNFLKQFSGKIKICMHTAWAETSPDRFWAIENWKNLIEKLIDKYGKKIIIFLSWTNFEKRQVDRLIKMLDKKYQKQVISLVNKFSLFEFAYFLKNCDLMISNDTWPMHLSSAMQTKTIWLFGPNLPERFGAWPLNKNINIYKWNWKVYVNVMRWKFEEDKEKNIEKISVEDVFSKINF